jgi:hypothetical protein
MWKPQLSWNNEEAEERAGLVDITPDASARQFALVKFEMLYVRNGDPK